MADYDVIFVNPEQLVASPFQPESRQDSGAAMNHLINSIKEDKLQYPPLVLPLADAGKYQIIDGHRRVAAMLRLGHTKIPVLPTQGRADALFAAVSGNVAKMRATEWITVYLKGGEVGSGPIKSQIKKLELSMGKEFLETLAQKNMSPAIWNLSNRVIKTLQADESIRSAVLEWLMIVGTREVSAWLTGQHSATELRQAMKEKRNPRHGLNQAAA